MTADLEIAQLRRIVLGKTLERETANLPQNTQVAHYTITGGRILVVALFGEVTTVFQATANNSRWLFNPSNGAADENLCANLDVTGQAVGRKLGITGLATDAMLAGQSIRNVIYPVIVGPGTIDFLTSANATGQMKSFLGYWPMDDAVVVTVNNP